MSKTDLATCVFGVVSRWAAVGALILLTVCPALSVASDNSRGKTPQLQRLDLELGYFTARRGDFREVFKGGITAGASYERRINREFGWGLRFSFRHQSEFITYWHIAASPYATYTLAESRSVRLLLGGGMGAGYRNVKATIHRTAAASHEIIDSYDATQRSFGAFTMAMAGFDLRLSERFCFGGRAYFDYYFTDQLFGDVKRGDFGDTGGLSFTGRIGFAL